jgi:hypothetical protein
MNFKLTIFFLFITCLAFGQSTKDTVVDYNGRQAKMRVEFDKDGGKTKETVFYDNGKVETIYYYSDNKNHHWIAYDTLGVKTAEWQDPEIENSKHRQKRNVALTIVSILFISLTWLSSKKIGYRTTYFVIGILTVFITVISFFIQNRIDYEQTNQFVTYTISSVVFCLPILLLTLSVSNFFRKTGIQVLFSIIFTLFCLWILLIYTMAILTAGAGMLG